eukprot:TRINITY_DN15251_c0_g1_i1.p1 TRINITY_DN15251_c0_g1~~TRINITY_DN15251_c0_g1_i1.p1  ORF type:complete len:106 (-),score=9.53 TRINITY_DN15251_c0_g1_i1:453-770(-)
MGNYLFKNTAKRKIKINDKFEKQLNLPKPVLIQIFCLMQFDELLMVSRCCKQIYFLLVSSQFWRRYLVVNTDIKIEDVDNLVQNKSYRDLYLEKTAGIILIDGYK